MRILSTKFEGWCKYFSPVKLVSLRKLAPSRNILCTGTSSIGMAQSLSLKNLSQIPVVNEKMLILSIDRGGKSDREINKVICIKISASNTLIIIDYY